MPESFFDSEQLGSLIETGYSILTPNFRLARRIKREWDLIQRERNLKAWRPLDVMPLEVWLERCWQRSFSLGGVSEKIPLDSRRANELWLRVIETDQLTHGQYSLLQTSGAAELAGQARENLLRWQLSPTDESLRQQFSLDEDCATFLRWLDEFQSQLQQGQLGTAADRITDLLTAQQIESGNQLALIDFDDIPPLYQACLEKYGEDVKYLDSGGQEVCPTVLSYPERERELEAVAAWAAAQHREDPQRTVGVILGDMQADRVTLEYLLRREFDCLGENYTSLPVNFSTGITLDRAPVVRDALRILGTVLDRISLAETVALIQSRFTGSGDCYSDCAVKLIDQLYEEGREQVDTDRLRYLSQRVKVGEHQGMDIGLKLAAVAELRLHRQKQSAAGWLQTFCQVLDLWSWPGSGPLDSLEYQQVELWYQTLEAFASCDTASGALSFSEARSLLVRYCQAQVSQPQTADTGVQVLGPLEAAGLHFETLWVCGLEGNRWPPPARPNPFLPLALQRSHSMPHASSEREWDFTERLMMRFQQNCNQLTASFSRHLDGTPALPSPLLTSFEVEHIDAPGQMPDAWLQQWQARQAQWLQDDKGPEVLFGPDETPGGGSALLQDQASCPFRAFARRRLELRPLGELRIGLSAAQRGTILHDALYVLWGQIGDSKTLQAMNQVSMHEATNVAVAGAITEVPAKVRESVGMPCLELEQQRLQSLVMEWLQLERDREFFEVVAREQPFELNLEGLALSLRVDRIDELANGAQLVVDYKSGKNSLGDWLGERPSQPQLPLYGLKGEVSGLAFAEVRHRESRWLGLGDTEGIPGVKTDIGKAVKRYSSAESWEQLQSQWRDNLACLARKFLNGDATVDPLNGACRYCGLQALCRVDIEQERGALAS